ncbi:MAG TPA: Uma2 family endonuclease [Spirochaetota bacterium]|nr:Uma2 family endonuclease [Spirochaetota bacterium]
MSEFAFNLNEKYTYKDYLDFPENIRCELINGVIYNMSPAPRRYHQKISTRLLVKFFNYLENKPCEVYDAPFDVRLPLTKENSDFLINTVVQPDIVVVCDKFKLDDAGCLGAPDLIVEIISESTASKDLKIKFNLYEKVGVKEYWIVFPDEKIIQIFKLKNGEYGKPEVFGLDDKIVVGLFPDLTIEVNDLFRSI